MKKILFVYLVMIISWACSDLHSQVVKAVKTQTSHFTFGDIFQAADSFAIPIAYVKAPIHFSSDVKRLIVCDYEQDCVDVFDTKGKFQFQISDSLSPQNQYRKLVHPICSVCRGDSIFIASNHGRRILTYLVKGNRASLVHSFIIPGENITPIDMVAFDDKLVMAGFNMHNSSLLHMYQDRGSFLKSFMPCNVYNSAKNDYRLSALNYPFADVDHGNIYAIEHLRYRLSEFDTLGNEISSSDIQPDYYVHEDADSINKSNKNFLKTSNLYSWPIQLKAMNNYVFVQLEMPGPAVFNSPQDYFSLSDFNMDIFDENCKPVYSGIKCGNRKLVSVSKETGIFYFIAGFSDKTHCYIIKTYTLKKQAT